MIEKAIELLNIFYDNGYEAYIVGGFVRDYIINRKSYDIDICTNATPMQIKEIFKEVTLPYEGYGAVHLTYKKNNFEITTYRMDLEYKDGRSPSKIMYTDKLIIDLKRRDFTMNTLCMDRFGNIIDLLESIDDIKEGIIKVVGNADKKFKEDSLRILRAIRFAAELNFKLDKDLINSIIANRKNLSELSYFRKKQELNKIFSSDNSLYGISLIKEYELDKYLGIKIKDRIVKTNDPIGMWVQVEPSLKYQFTSNEKDYMDKIKTVLKKNEIDNITLYKYGNYVCYISAQILGINEVNVYNKYDNLVIHKTSDIVLKPLEIIDILQLKDKSKIKIILSDLEDKIINKKLANENEELKKYVIETYFNNMV